MTDNEIAKALECCTTNGASCKDCPAFVKVDRSNCKKYFRGALDLINRQKAEIEKWRTHFQDLDIECERLEKANESLKAEREDFKFLYENLKEEHLEIIKAIKHDKAEAYKEFAERLIHKITNTPTTFPSTYFPYRDGIKYREAEIIAMIKELAGDKK